MSRNYRDSLTEQLKDPSFRKEWEALEPEYQLIRAVLETREQKGISQQELSEITGINQADISRIENGNANPSLRTMKRLASGLGMKIRLEFVPIEE